MVKKAQLAELFVLIVTLAAKLSNDKPWAVWGHFMKHAAVALSVGIVTVIGLVALAIGAPTTASSVPTHHDSPMCSHGECDHVPPPEHGTPSGPAVCNWISFEADVKWCMFNPCGNNRDRCQGKEQLINAARTPDGNGMAQGFSTCQSHNHVADSNGGVCMQADHTKAFEIVKKYQ